MTLASIATGLFLTGLVFTFFSIGAGIWVSEGSWQRCKYSPAVLALCIVTALLFIAAAWTGVAA